MKIQLVDMLPDNPNKIVRSRESKQDGFYRMMTDLRNNQKKDCGENHSGRCPGIITHQLAGWTLPARSDIKLEHGVVVGRDEHNMVWPNYLWNDFFPGHKDNILIKHELNYLCYIEGDCDVMYAPVAFPDGESWYPAPGILKSDQYPHKLSVFIITTNPNLFIPAGSPLCSMHLTPKQQPVVEERAFNEQDAANIEILSKWQRKHMENPKRNYNELAELPWYNYG